MTLLPLFQEDACRKLFKTNIGESYQVGSVLSKDLHKSGAQNISLLSL